MIKLKFENKGDIQIKEIDVDLIQENFRDII